MKQQDFERWLESPTTKAFMASIEEMKADMATHLLEGGLLDHEPGRVAMHYAERTGILTGLELAMRHEPEFDDDQH